jgi:predicted metalloprotease
VRWRDLRRSDNVDDIRGGGSNVGIGGAIGLVIAGIVALVTGGPSAVVNLIGSQLGAGPAHTQTAGPDQARAFVASILGSTEDVWTAVLASAGIQYVPPRLVMFDGAVESACGYTTSATGPFYCPLDQRVYIDVEFFQQLASMGGPGDFAQAYVIGHEVGHHVQNLTGASAQVRRLQAENPDHANELSVMLELQADCYAGVWANYANRTQRVLEPGDVDEGLQAASVIGDDWLQASAGRAVTPETFTHGTSAQRVYWLNQGLSTGNVEACDTYSM